MVVNIELFIYKVSPQAGRRPLGALVDRTEEQTVYSAGIRGWYGVALVVHH